jgi:ABC-type sugar transport system permease subunit
VREWGTASVGCASGWGRGFVGPALGLYGFFMLAPALAAFLWAFTRWDGIGQRTWAGLYNFKSLLFESDALWTALGNNLS